MLHRAQPRDPHRLRRLPRSRSSANGAAALGLTTLLLLVATLCTLYAAEDLLLTQRSAAQRLHAAQAFEAAESGLDWTLAQLDGVTPVGTDCQPDDGPSARTLRARSTAFDAATGIFRATGADIGCVLAGAVWACHCGAPMPPVAASGPAFTATLLPTDRPGELRVRVTGCSELAAECGAASAEPAEAVARHQTTLALLAALPRPPAAAVTVRGRFDVGQGAPHLRSADAAGGVAVQAGGAVRAPAARMDAAAVGNDPALATTSPGQFFASHFGSDEDTWKASTQVTAIACHGRCDAALADALDRERDRERDREATVALIHVSGDLSLDGPFTLGTTARPVVIVVSGAVRLSGAVVLHGLLHGASLHWAPGLGEGSVHGALLAAGDYTGEAAPELVHDAEVLRRIALGAGRFVPLNGAWRDF